MVGNKESKRVTKYVKEAFKCDFGQIAPVTLILALRASRVLRNANGMENREFQLLLVIDALTERNEKRIGEAATCKAEIDMLITDVQTRKTIDLSLAALRAHGYILGDNEHTRWSYNSYSYSLTVSGRQIMKQYRQQLEALQIELNTAKCVR